MTSLSGSGSNNNSRTSLSGAFPESSDNRPQSGSGDITNEAVYNHGYAEEQQRLHNNTHSNLLALSGPTTLPPSYTGVTRQVSNRSSVPNLARQQQGQQDMYRSHETPGAVDDNKKPS
ncbi:hypothetical protein BGX31_010691 [Mortierella sp. GBA43]|nr:hypothetical protein BGX31_010691 [Mortierella sp. GBA43]